MCYSTMVKRALDELQREHGAVAVRTDFQVHQQRVKDNPKAFPPPEEDNRIFPGHYAPVIYTREAQRVVSPMRYGAFPPPGVKDSAYTTFNARRDNLTSRFWQTAFMQHHGFMVIEAFYEWVEVKDLLSAGAVTIEQVRAEFERQIEERKAKVLAAGKKHKLTPTEQKDPHFRKIVIEFRPEDGEDLVVPVIFNLRKADDGEWDKACAIVTDDPQPEIAAAGHDRCPVLLMPDALDTWLAPEKSTPEELIELLGARKKVTFRHRLAEAA